MESLHVALFPTWIADFVPDNIAALCLILHTWQMGVYTGGCVVAACTCLGPHDKILLWAQILAARVFVLFVVYPFQVVSWEPSVIVEGRLSSIFPIRDVTSYRFLLPSFSGGFPLSSSYTFPTLLPSLALVLSSFLFTSNDPHFSSPFCLTTPLFGGSSTAGLKWPHLLPLILFVPHLTFSLFLFLPSALLPASVHHPPTLSSNSITFCTLFIYSSSPSLPSPAISPSTSHLSEKYLSAFTLDIWHPLTLSWFNLHSSSVCLPYSYPLPLSLSLLLLCLLLSCSHLFKSSLEI